MLELSPELKAVCDNPALPIVAQACGACDETEAGAFLRSLSPRARAEAVHDATHELADHHQHEHQHYHLERRDLAVFEEDPDNRPYVWDLEENCKCH